MMGECQEDIQSLVSTYAACVLSIAVWSIMGFLLQCCCLELDGSPGLAAQFFAVVGVVQLGMVVCTVTIFFPYCPESCLGNCNDDQLGWFYLVPAVEGLLAGLWLRASWNRAVVARALLRRSDDNDNNNIMNARGPAIFSKLPANEADATELELTETGSETDEYGYHDNDDDEVVMEGNEIPSNAV